jgi:RNA polymerase sigma-70 factor (ECF subfamily)
VTRELVRLAAQGDQAAFEALARASAGRMFAIAWRILRDHDLAEDAVQQSLSTVWDKLPDLRDPDRFRAWTDRLITRAALADARRARRRSSVRLVDSHDGSLLASDDIQRVADRDRIERGFERLTVDQRAVLVLRHYAGMSHAEIASALGVPEGTVASRLHHASRALRSSIEADERLGKPSESLT